MPRALAFFSALLALALGPATGLAAAADGAKAPPAKAPAEPPRPPAEALWAEIAISGAYPEHIPIEGGGLALGGPKESFYDLLARFRKAEGDASVRGILVDLTAADGLDAGQADEVRARIEAVRKAGKRAVALLSIADARRYRIACACDEILLDPAGALLLTGLRLEAWYVKPLLDKLGIEFLGVQRGRYKNALEPLTHDAMTPESKEVYDAILDRVYGALVEAGASGRRMEAGAFRKALDEGPFSAEEALKRGLVDALVADGDVAERLRAKEGPPARVARGYGAQRTAAPSSAMELWMALLGGTSKEAPSGDRIAIVFLEGMIQEGAADESPFGGSAVFRKPSVRLLRRLRQDGAVRAVVLRVNSPGGSAPASDAIAEEVRRLAEKKPVIASFGGVAASGGYYLSAPARAIYAEPATLTGSIGVFGGKPVLAGLLDKVGIRPQVLTRGEHGGLFSPSAGLDEGERKALESLLDETYRRFLKVVSDGRKRPVDDIAKVAEGRVWIGADAKEKGLVDEMGGLWDAVLRAKREAGFADDKKVPLELLPKRKTLLEALFQAGGDAQTLAPRIGLLLGEIDPALPRLEATARLLKENPGLPMALWPAVVEVR